MSATSSSWQTTHNTRLYAVISALSRTLSAQEVGAVIVGEGVAALEADKGVLGMVGETGDHLDIVSAEGYPNGVLDQWITIPLDSARPITEVVRTGQAIWLESIEQAQALYPALRPILERSGSQATASAPLVVDGRILGALGVSYNQPHQFDEAERAFFTTLAHQCAQALERARLFEAERHARTEAEQLYTIAQQEIAERKRIEAMLREQTETLERLNRQAQEAVRVRDDFLAAASHDLKNPLAAIQGTAQVLQRTLNRTGTIPPERLSAGLESIELAIAQMTGQINELLDVARLRLGQPLSLDRRPTDLVALVRRVVTSYQSATERHHIQFMVENGTGRSVEDHLAREVIGNWDAPRIERVVDNLLSNALKYSPDGGEIFVRVRREEGYALLSVKDQGVGIPQADLPGIFERFTRARNVIGRFGGSGIGLAASHQVVTQHGGEILVESREAHGSTFVVRLPIGT